MADLRLYNPAVRIFLAFPQAFEDWQNPTVAELNANPTNSPNGLVFDITCAVNQDGTTFDLGDSETDDSLTFCQVAGAVNPTSLVPEVVLEVERSSDRLAVNTANLAQSLLTWRGVEMFAILSIGEEPGADFAVGDRVKMALIATDYATDVFGTGENLRLTSDTANRGDVNWNYALVA